ncbi:hypothetical protein ABZT49_28060 [Methylobacterium sp. EM32]|uniref:hypothetical protein n=1 Tax=Methylobacterium sp. EM32 TaxID=3163481 RepID=UPI0033A410CF
MIDVPSQTALPAAISLRMGDVLLVRATGGAVAAGDAVECLGALGAAALHPDGSVLAAMGGPDAVVFRARAPGRATIEVVRGSSPGGPSRITTVSVSVAP